MGPLKRGFPIPVVAMFVLTPAALLAQVPAGAEFQVNTHTTGGQSWAAVAREPDGDFMVAWKSQLQDGSGHGIFARRYDASGAPRGAEFRVNTYTTSDQQGAWVAADGRGRYVVVWSTVMGQPPTNLPRHLVGQRYAADGAPLGGEFRVTADSTTADQYWGRAAASRNGDLVVVWQDYANLTELKGERFSRTGERLGAFQVTAATAGSVLAPALDVRPDGGFVVAWTAPDGPSADYGIFARRFDATGPLGAEFRVNSYTTGDQAFPSVALAASGSFVVVWESWGQDGALGGVFGQRFASDGTPLGAEFQVNTYTSMFQGNLPSVDADAAGNFVVAWATDAPQDGNGTAVMARRYAADGQPRSGEFVVNGYTTGVQYIQRVAADEVGNFVVTWQDMSQDGSAAGIFAQRFGGLHPRALAVDTAPGPLGDGNRVLEPGEAVNVVPRWQNLSGSPQTVAATVDAVSAPAGCIQVLLDGTGNYGTVPDGATAPCTDCHRVLAWSEGRCQQHWDISMAERLTPDTQGQVKAWSLHVGESFGDVPDSSPFYRSVETLLHHDITGGCSATEYCPSSSTTRGQMPVFVLLAREGAGYAPPACEPPNMFDDVPETSPFCRWVEEAARRGIAAGCSSSPPLYCPNDPVVRDQMAVLILRAFDPALNPPACVAGGEMFADVPASSPFCRWIEELARRGVVTGCGGGNYCPRDPVTREQMAVFITVTFGLGLYGP